MRNSRRTSRRVSSAAAVACTGIQVGLRDVAHSAERQHIAQHEADRVVQLVGHAATRRPSEIIFSACSNWPWVRFRSSCACRKA